MTRKVYPQVPPKVEYGSTGWGGALRPARDAPLKWAEQRGGPVDSTPRRT